MSGTGEDKREDETPVYGIIMHGTWDLTGLCIALGRIINQLGPNKIVFERRKWAKEGVVLTVFALAAGFRLAIELINYTLHCCGDRQVSRWPKGLTYAQASAQRNPIRRRMTLRLQLFPSGTPKPWGLQS